MRGKKIVWTLLIAICFMFPLQVGATSTHEGTYTIILQRMYLSGDASEELLTIEHQEPTAIMKMYKDWTLVYYDDEQYVFLKKVDDISPFMKEHGFFGITDDGFFHLYEMSLKHKKVIQSFFHVDTKKIEASRREKYQKGIRVVSKSQYVQVIEEMEHYRK